MLFTYDQDLDQGWLPQQNLQRKIIQRYKKWKSCLPFLYEDVRVQKFPWPIVRIVLVEGRFILAGNTKENGFLLRVNKDEQQKFVNEDEYYFGSKVNNISLSKPKRILAGSTLNFEEGNINLISSNTEKGKYKVMKKLKHHKSIALGLEFCPLNEIILASLDQEGKICIWNVETQNLPTTELQFQQTDKGKINGHYSNINSKNNLGWSLFEADLFGACSDRSCFQLYDLRMKEQAKTINFTERQESFNDFCCICFSPVKKEKIIIGTGSGKILSIDKRNPDKVFQTFDHHLGSVTKISFKEKSSWFASSSRDRTVCLWNSNAKTGEPKFLHSGHSHEVLDVNWMNTKKTIEIVSSDSNSVVQYYSVKKEVVK
eukprot:snap_masked-scaffold_63-processed-gene-0.36-mRNA-1 protein AED:1.00 eAED:1.00 QI:0/0/0/0/1/1/2/0/371